MTEERFVADRQESWSKYEKSLLPLKRTQRRFIFSFPENYRRLCQDLNHAKAANYSAELIDRLNQLVWEGHQILYGRKRRQGSNMARVFLIDFPQTFRREHRMVFLGHILFYLPALVIFFYLTINPPMTGLFLDQDLQSKLEQMYDPSSEFFLTPRETNGSADMFGFYILNNIGIGFSTFAGGALAGIGSLFFLIFNACNLGAAAGHIVNIGYSSTFFPFIATHSSFELTALIITAVAGLKIGWAIIAPGRLTRTSAMTLAARKMVPLMAGAFIFLVLAAIIEAFWSSLPMDSWIKYLSAGASWLLVYGFLIGGSRRGS